jgi:hypothetical protein
MEGEIARNATALSAPLPGRDHGFIAAVGFTQQRVGGRFSSLKVGQEVRASEAVGKRGMQAALVRRVGGYGPL